MLTGQTSIIITKMLSSERSSFILCLFYCIGIAPYTRTRNLRKLRSVTHLIPVSLSSLLSLCLTIFLLIFPHFESLGPIHTIINFSYIWSLFFTILSANCQCHLYKSVYRRATYRIRQIHKSFREKLITKFLHQFQRRYKIKILIIFILFFASQGLVFVEVWLISETSGLWTSLTASFVTSSLRILYPMHVLHIVLYSDVLTMFIKNINLQATQTVSLCSSWTGKVEFLRNIKSMHMDIVKLTADINIFFGAHLLFLMINSFIYIFYQLYWLFLAFQLHWGWLAIIDGLVSFSYGTVSILILVNSCQSCSLEINFLVKNVEENIFWTNDDVLLYQLKQEVFSQIIHLPLYVSANEYFNVDGKVLANITGSFCMYILMFIQFFFMVK